MSGMFICNTQSQVRSSTTEDGCIASVTEIQKDDCIVLVFTLFQGTPFVLRYYRTKSLLNNCYIYILLYRGPHRVICLWDFGKKSHRLIQLLM